VADRTELAAVFRHQSHTAAHLGSPLVAALLARAAEDVAAGGPLARLVGDFRGHPVLDNLPLRVVGAVHAEVLAGRAPALAAFFPSAGGTFEAEGAWQALRALVDERAEALAPRLSEPLQTNEVRRCCALVGGFLRVAARHGLPLRLLEIGASAGLNLLWDRYGYALGPHRFGPRDAPLQLDTAWSGPPPELAAPVRVATRAGCDLRPLHAADAEQRLRVESFVWPDQVDRLARLRAALAAAAQDPPPVAPRRAGDWLGEVLAAQHPGVATVVFHSVVWWYIPDQERATVTETMERAGARAAADRPLAWLRMEGASTAEAELRLLEWPGGADVLLGRCHWHGAWVAWA
jgi:hypothetical protein